MFFLLDAEETNVNNTLYNEVLRSDGLPLEHFQVKWTAFLRPFDWMKVLRSPSSRPSHWRTSVSVCKNSTAVFSCDRQTISKMIIVQIITEQSLCVLCDLRTWSKVCTVFEPAGNTACRQQSESETKRLKKKILSLHSFVWLNDLVQLQGPSNSVL